MLAAKQKYQISINQVISAKYIENFLRDPSESIFSMARRVANGHNPNEIKLINKSLKNKYEVSEGSLDEKEEILNSIDTMTKHLARQPFDGCLVQLIQRRVTGRNKAGLNIQGAKKTALEGTTKTATTAAIITTTLYINNSMIIFVKQSYS